jgi:hypothetical protein
MDHRVNEFEYWWTELTAQWEGFVASLFVVGLFMLIWTVVAAIIAVPLATVLSAAGAVGGHSTPKGFLKWFATAGFIVWSIGITLACGLKILFTVGGFGV